MRSPCTIFVAAEYITNKIIAYMKTFAIINAMQKEHELLAEMLHDTETVTDGTFQFLRGRIGEAELVMMQSGIGKVNAAIGGVELIRRFSPAAVVNTGVAGGIDASLQVADVVAGSQVVYHDVDCGPETELGRVQGLPLFYEADAALLDVARNVKAESRVVEGLICSGDQFITDKTQLAQIKSRFPKALAVDMESAALAQVCHIYQVPFLSFRIVSDTPGAEEHFDQYLNFWDEMAARSFAVTRAFVEALVKD